MPRGSGGGADARSGQYEGTGGVHALSMGAAVTGIRAFR
jgi:hypothetical protein